MPSLLFSATFPEKEIFDYITGFESLLLPGRAEVLSFD